MRTKLLFGTAGPPGGDADGGTVGGIRRARASGLGCMEVEFVRGVKMGEATAAAVRAAAGECEIKLSCHAPYYINLASPDREKRKSSIMRLFEAARIGRLCGADSTVFHPGFYMGRKPGKIYVSIRSSLEKVLKMMKEAGVEGMALRPELTGKPSQFGDLDEILRLSADLENTAPCVDFSHYYSRSAGAFNTQEDFAGAVEKIGAVLGGAAVENLHLHISGILHGPAGERCHRPLEDSEFRYRDLLRALAAAGAGGRVICESPNEVKEKDALLMQRCYGRYVEKTKEKNRA